MIFGAFWIVFLGFLVILGDLVIFGVFFLCFLDMLFVFCFLTLGHLG